jgi:outer membrane protein assembly factor BamB
MTPSFHSLGTAHAWKESRAAASMGGRIYLAGADGYLHVVDGQTGEASVLGGGAGWQIRLLAATRGHIYAFDEAGPLYAVAPSGAWERLDGDWSEVRAAVGSDQLYVMGAGRLTSIDCNERTWRHVGEGAWNTELLLATSNHLFALEEDGSLYRIDRDDGSFEQLDGDWGDVTAGAGAAGRLFLMASTGALYAVSIQGDFEPVDTGTKWDTRVLMAGPSCLYALEHSGSLYVIPLPL